MTADLKVRLYWIVTEPCVITGVIVIVWVVVIGIAWVILVAWVIVIAWVITRVEADLQVRLALPSSA